MHSSTSHIIIALGLLAFTDADATYNTAEKKIIEDGYPLEVHNITTEDGYILTVHRIPNADRPVMLLNHGFVASSDAFLWLGKPNALPYQAHEAGYDVWMLNCRGNWYSSKHKAMSPHSRKFWQFSIHEIGKYDLPASFDYVLKAANRTSLHYVGHSQGTAVFLIFLSERPEYNKRILSAHLLAPVAFMAHGTSVIMLFLFTLARYPTDYTSIAVFQHAEAITTVGRLFCPQDRMTATLCKIPAHLLAGFDGRNINYIFLPQVYATYPAGSSLNQLIHLSQLYHSKDFRQLDWGPNRNKKKYGQFMPPNYKLRNVKAPTFIYFSRGDAISNFMDVKKLIKRLPNVINAHFIDDDQWNHGGFLLANTVKEEINDRVIQYSDKFN